MAASFKNIIRVGVIEQINYEAQIATIIMADRVDRRTFQCPIAHPLVMDNGGMFVSPEIGTLVAVGFSYNEAPFILAYIPKSSYAQDITLGTNTTDFFSGISGYPSLVSGEMALQGSKGSLLKFARSGNIEFQFGQNGSACYTGRDTIGHAGKQNYVNTEAHLVVTGQILRDTRQTIRPLEAVFDKLIDPSYDEYLSPLGRNPELAPATITNATGSSETLRNPGLVENRSLTYEFLRTDQVGVFKQEVDRLSPSAKFQVDKPNERSAVRADALNLNPLSPNNLMEEIRGTVVDRYGNILDINRNKLDYTQIDLKGGPQRLEAEDTLLRRSVKYHLEINSRKPPVKEVRYDILDARNGTEVQNGHLHSRWTVDVDGEGLTKVNIPASSDTGNIPLLTRYVNTSMKEEDNSWSFRDPNATDVLHLAFGELSEDGGIEIENPGYVPQNVAAEGEPGAGQPIKYRTAWHNLPTTAQDTTGSLATEVTVTNSDGYGNAGGRSLHTNLDGSLELNVGKDTVDGKSWVFDSSGSVIARVGKDKKENSVVAQYDGNVCLQVGGDSIESEQKVSNPSFKVFIETDAGFHEIEANGDGVFIKSAPGKNIVFNSGNNLVLTSAGETLIGGEVISMYGTTDELGSAITGERLVERNGKTVK